MKDKQAHKRRKNRYIVTTIFNGEMKEQVMSRAERANLDPKDVDVQIDEPRGEIWIKYQEGEAPVRYRFSEVHIGGYEQKLLADAFFSAGDIVLLESGRYMNQRIARLRRLFKTSKEDETFLRTTNIPYGLAINTERCWRYVEALAEPASTVSKKGQA
ncbi:MAG: hypothetical protein P8Z79_00680 [Sedimentisphaerales bacterium]|jgi:hypothetical protein